MHGHQQGSEGGGEAWHLLNPDFKKSNLKRKEVYQILTAENKIVFKHGIISVLMQRVTALGKCVKIFSDSLNIKFVGKISDSPPPLETILAVLM